VVEKDIWEFFAYSTIQTSPQSNAIALLTSGVTRNLWSSHDINCRQLLIGHSSSSPLHSLGKGRACYRLALVFVTEASICRQMAGQQQQQPQSREALSNTISATEDVIIILCQSGDDRPIFTASNVSEAAVLWQRPFKSQAPANPHLTFYPPSGPSCCCSAARIISTFPAPRFEERKSPIALARDLGFGMTHQRVMMESDRGL
jgi:hypothetical protein